MSETKGRFGSVPPSARAPGEDHTFVLAEDGTRLFVRTKRAGHDAGACHVVFCDGILCDGFIWKYLWDDLAPRFPLAHWHYRGHGRSASPEDEGRIDIAAHASDLMAVRAHLGGPPVVLVGHSMGTQVCLEAYHRYPDKVRGLVLVCGSYGKVTQSFRGMPLLDLILPKLMDIVDKQPEIARAIWTRIPPEVALKLALKSRDVDPDKVHAEDMLPYLHHMTHVDFPMFLRMLRAAGDHSAEGYLGDVKVPVLVVAGEKDTFTPASLSEHMGQAMPYAELLMVSGGTHVAPIEQPALIRDRIVSFLERVLPADEITKTT